MVKKNNLLILLVLTLFISGCSGGLSPRPYRTDFHTGTDGIVLDFLPNSPPDEVLEGSVLPVYVLLSNEGAFSLNESSKGTLTFSYTEAFLEQMDGTAPSDWDTVPTKGSFYGKSMFYPEGEQRYQLLPSIYSTKLPGQISNPEVIVSASLCYPYRTILSDEICIDTTPMTGDVRRKICELEDKNYPQGQGAPVAISSIKFEMQQYGLHMRPVLFIEIENVGGGRVLAPVDFSNACADQASMSDRRNHVIVKASLSGEELTCINDGLTNLDNELTRCYMDSGGFGAHLNYYANLEVTLDYVYRSSISKEFEIYRLDAPELLPVDDGCEYWESKVGGSDGTCMSRCEACSLGELSCGVVFPEVEAATWECTSSEGGDSGGILKTPTFEPFFYSTNNCIEDPGFCAPGNICCARPACLDIDTCKDYKLSYKSCNSNACDLPEDCYWAGDVSLFGGGCKTCDYFEGSCELYEDSDTCKENPCAYQGDCKWDSTFFGSCKNKAEECSDYTKVNDCVFDVDKLKGIDCVWTSLDVCEECQEPLDPEDNSCKGLGVQTDCVANPGCYWESNTCKQWPIDNCALYNHKKSCREDSCDFASSQSIGCTWENNICKDRNIGNI